MRIPACSTSSSRRSSSAPARVHARREDLDGLAFARDARRPVLAENPAVLDELATAFLERANGG